MKKGLTANQVERLLYKAQILVMIIETESTKRMKKENQRLVKALQTTPCQFLNLLLKYRLTMLASSDRVCIVNILRCSVNRFGGVLDLFSKLEEVTG